MSITPIFILGEIRNGTTGLCNDIGSLKTVYTPMHKYHMGSHESSLFEKQKVFAKIKSINEYMQFLVITAASDYFNILDVSEEILYKEKYSNYYKLFFELMDSAAQNNNCRFWLTKLSPQFCNNKKEYDLFEKELQKRYQDAKYITIKRDISPAVHSYLNMRSVAANRKNSAHKYLSVLAYTLSYVHNYNIYKKIIEVKKGISLDFNYYINNSVSVIKEIADYLKIKYEVNSDAIIYRKNSSYFMKNEKATVPSWSVKAAMIIACFTNNLLPGLIKRIGRNRNKKLFRFSSPGFSYRLISMNKIEDIFLDELKYKNSGLYEIINTK